MPLEDLLAYGLLAAIFAGCSLGAYLALRKVR
jgi:hypothetical protein